MREWNGKDEGAGRARWRRRALVTFLCATAALAPPPARATEPASSRHLIYLHGRIVQAEQSSRPVHPRFGAYELDAILGAFRARGFVVDGEIRPKDDTVESAAERAESRVRQLLASGVPPARIGVVGASMGASIALLVSTRMQQPEVRYAILGACLSRNVSALTASEGRAPRGRILSIREKSDDFTEPCPAFVLGAAAPGLRGEEVLLRTGLAHGFLYRPLPEWFDPVVTFLRAP